MKLVRRFTPLNMLFISINGMIGSAWLFAPLYAAKIAGSEAIIAWLIAGGATILIALTFVEIAILVPTAGGSTRIPQLSHGEFTSFVMSWITWLSCVTMPPIEVQAVLQYASTYFHSLTHVVNNASVLTHSGMIWATLIMFGLCVINVVSFKGLVRFNKALFFFKVAVIVLTFGWLIRTSFHTVNFQIGTHGFNWPAIFSAVATGGIAFAFTGFKHGIELAGETIKSNVALPLGIIGSIVLCLLLYLGLQIAFIGAIEPEALKRGWSLLSFSGDVGPFAGIAALLGLIILVKLLYVDAVVSPLGAGLIYVTSTSRIVYAMSASNYIPPFFSRVNNQNFPIWAIGLNFVVGMLLFLPLPGWQNMVGFLVSAVVISYTMGPIALLCFRKKLPQEKRVFNLPVAHILCLVAFYFCNLMFYWTGWETVSKLAIAVAIGMVLFIFTVWYQKASWKQLGMKAAFWIVPYLFGLTVISYYGSFGGTEIIPFGWDFLVIAVFSVVMLYLAIQVSAVNVLQEYRQWQKSVIEES